MRKYRIPILLSLLIVMSYGCDLKNKKTTIEIVDAKRHYYPVLRGQELDVVYEIINTGEYPLFIEDVKTSCGCMVVDESSFKVLPSKGKGFIRIKYDSSKNIGYVKHYVSIYANLESELPLETSFDLHVVPNALYTRDYEELYTEQKKKLIDEKSLVDGRENELSYYIDESPR